MLLGEPQRTQADLNFVLFGIPIRIHPIFWLLTLILGRNLGDAGAVFIWVGAVLLSILVHELGHAAAMRLYGYYPWIVLYGLGGLTCRDFGYARRSNHSESVEQVLVSLAGPMAGFLLAAALILGVFAAGYGHSLELRGPWRLVPYIVLQNARLGSLFNDVFFICTLWGLVNLLPIYPLDGGQIAREVFLKFSPRDGIVQSLIVSIVVATIMAILFLSHHGWYEAILFGYLAYSGFFVLQSQRGRGPWQ
jgi:stage IV sporulation protein FB